ncbi:DUF2157 domain-containing protein [Rhizoctonia solani AG-1 IA]|uniref:DUF2157 domain-containing protein n=1 Tax=Thanatephorus cucumeris (strain AG1-IA) TaxID=983506 RepID=L8X1C2_THACA|nr:DUF2157 domain-containing protein [Rhizoctonia solani AG-1 IA]
MGVFLIGLEMKGTDLAQVIEILSWLGDLAWARSIIEFLTARHWFSINRRTRALFAHLPLNLNSHILHPTRHRHVPINGQSILQ